MECFRPLVPETDADPDPATEARRGLEQALWECKRIIVGQDDMLQKVLVALLAGGHVLLEGGEIERAYLGVSSTVDPSEDGAVVATIAQGGPAADSELRPGDRITAAGDREIAEPSDFSSAIVEYKPGDRIDLTVVRDGEQRTIEVQLGTRPDQPARG